MYGSVCSLSRSRYEDGVPITPAPDSSRSTCSTRG